ncbi:uncharacterized protein [Haliotis asinina]|uniref:uncharacterized protein n=1 Tax=Haliotis asinina TaxID=109174 RepID=UPI003531A0E4
MLKCHQGVFDNLRRFTSATHCSYTGVSSQYKREEVRKSVTEFRDETINRHPFPLFKRDTLILQPDEVGDFLDRAKVDQLTSEDDQRLVMQHLSCAIIQHFHAQRPSVESCMKLADFNKAQCVVGRYQISFMDHKTSMSFLVTLSLCKEDYDTFRHYRQYVRGDMPEDAKPNKSPFFRRVDGTEVENMCLELARYQRTRGFLKINLENERRTFTTTYVRKALETEVSRQHPNDAAKRKMASDYLAHSQKTVHRYYAKKTPLQAASECAFVQGVIQQAAGTSNAEESASASVPTDSFTQPQLQLQPQPHHPEGKGKSKGKGKLKGKQLNCQQYLKNHDLLPTSTVCLHSNQTLE